MKIKAKKVRELQKRVVQPIAVDDLKKVAAGNDGAIWNLTGVFWG